MHLRKVVSHVIRTDDKDKNKNRTSSFMLEHSGIDIIMVMTTVYLLKIDNGAHWLSGREVVL